MVTPVGYSRAPRPAGPWKVGENRPCEGWLICGYGAGIGKGCCLSWVRWALPIATGLFAHQGVVVVCPRRLTPRERGSRYF